LDEKIEKLLQISKIFETEKLLWLPGGK